MENSKRLLLLVFLIVAFAAQLGHGWGRENKDRVRLDGVNALTLKKGAYTTGRRSSPVPQVI
jgi:hypothetical protein